MNFIKIYLGFCFGFAQLLCASETYGHLSLFPNDKTLKSIVRVQEFVEYKKLIADIKDLSKKENFELTVFDNESLHVSLQPIKNQELLKKYTDTFFSSVQNKKDLQKRREKKGNGFDDKIRDLSKKQSELEKELESYEKKFRKEYVENIKNKITDQLDLERIDFLIPEHKGYCVLWVVLILNSNKDFKNDHLLEKNSHLSLLKIKNDVPFSEGIIEELQKTMKDINKKIKAMKKEKKFSFDTVRLTVDHADKRETINEILYASS